MAIMTKPFQPPKANPILNMDNSLERSPEASVSFAIAHSGNSIYQAGSSQPTGSVTNFSTEVSNATAGTNYSLIENQWAVFNNPSKIVSEAASIPTSFVKNVLLDVGKEIPGALGEILDPIVFGPKSKDESPKTPDEKIEIANFRQHAQQRAVEIIQGQSLIRAETTTMTQVRLIGEVLTPKVAEEEGGYNNKSLDVKNMQGINTPIAIAARRSQLLSLQHSSSIPELPGQNKTVNLTRAQSVETDQNKGTELSGSGGYHSSGAVG